MDKHTLTAEERTMFGRKIKSIRSAGNLPGNIFGKDVDSRAVTVVRSDFSKVFAEAGETGIVDLVLGKDTIPVLVANVQTHPVTDEPLHVDFRQVNMKEKIEAQVPIEITGESPAEKQGLGIVVQQLDEVSVEALPLDLPENFEVDISNLEEVGATITVADLPSTDKVKILDDVEKVVVKVEELQEEEAEPEPVAAEGEIADGAAPTTEAPADGEPSSAEASEGQGEDK